MYHLLRLDLLVSATSSLGHFAAVFVVTAFPFPLVMTSVHSALDIYTRAR